MRIKTILIMKASAVTLALVGLALTFLATEAAEFLLISSTGINQILIQLLGAAYFGFAMLNWMAKGVVMGGIYNRPITIANFAHFFMGGMAILKAVIKYPNLPWLLWAIGVLFVIFALLFGMILVTTPVSKQKLSAAT